MKRTIQAARSAVRDFGHCSVPLHLRNASSDLEKSLGFGTDYQYPHTSGGYNGQRGLPDELNDRVIFDPIPVGQERQFIERLSSLQGAPPSSDPADS